MISFDPREKSELAVSKKSYLKLYDRAQADHGLHFLTADESAIKTITKQIGFRYYWNEKANEWASCLRRSSHDCRTERFRVIFTV